MIDIEFDRQAKEYRWTDPESGEILTAPPKKKMQLWRAAVCLLEPDLFTAAQRIIDRNPQLERVTWRAVELVLDNAVDVLPTPAGDLVALVESSDQYGRYAVQNCDGYFTCDCPHFVEMQAPITLAGRRYCKHIIAFRLEQTRRVSN